MSHRTRDSGSAQLVLKEEEARSDPKRGRFHAPEVLVSWHNIGLKGRRWLIWLM